MRTIEKSGRVIKLTTGKKFSQLPSLHFNYFTRLIFNENEAVNWFIFMKEKGQQKDEYAIHVARKTSFTRYRI